MIPKYIQLYNAAVAAGYVDPDERDTPEEWWACVGDFGIDDARQALESYIRKELREYQLDVVKAARWYCESGQDREIYETLERLRKFQVDYALDNTGKPLE